MYKIISTDLYLWFVFQFLISKLKICASFFNNSFKEVQIDVYNLWITALSVEKLYTQAETIYNLR